MFWLVTDFKHTTYLFHTYKEAKEYFDKWKEFSFFPLKLVYVNTSEVLE